MVYSLWLYRNNYVLAFMLINVVKKEKIPGQAPDMTIGELLDKATSEA
jgi:hypothetical protein